MGTWGPRPNLKVVGWEHGPLGPKEMYRLPVPSGIARLLLTDHLIQV